MTAYSFNTPLTTDEYTHLRQDHWQADLLISLCDNILAFSAQMASTQPTVSGGTSAVLPYTSVSSGDIANLDEGMVVIVSPTSDPRYPTAVRLRLRLDGVADVVADGTYLYVSEYSDILGLGEYIFVYYAYDLIDSLSRPTGVSPNVVQLEDYNQPFETMAPVIRGADDTPLQLGYADWVTTGVYDVEFDLSGTFSPQSGATIASYLVTMVPTGSGVASVIAGSPTTAHVTYSFTPGEYWGRVDVEDSLGVAWFRHVLIKAHDPVDYPPNDGFEGVEVTRDIAQGHSGRVKYYDGVSTMLNGTLAIFWSGSELYCDEDFGNSSGSLFGNIALVGWIETEENQFQTDPTYSAYSEVAFEVQGVGARLARIEGQLLAITNNSLPSAWDQIKNLTPWRAIVHFLQHHTQALHLCDFTSNDLTDTYLFPTITTIGGNGLDNVSGQQGIAYQIRSALEFARDGRLALITRADYYASPSVDLTDVATWTGDDIVGQISLKLNHYVQYGFINIDGASWSGGSAAPLPFLSRAPGLAQSSGAEQGQFNNQILAAGVTPAGAQAQLNSFGGTKYAIDNSSTELIVTHPDGYWWLEVSLGQLYIFDLGAEYNVRGIVLDSNTLWMLKAVSIRHDNKQGTREVQATYIPVVSGFPGATVPIINNSALQPPIVIPPMPAFNFELPETTIPDAGLPTSTTTPPTTNRQGQIVLEVGSDGEGLYICQNYILLAAPTWRAYTPPLSSGYTLRDACFDQLGSVNGAIAVYAVASDDTNSIIFYNANVVDSSSAWSQTGTPFAGIYDQIRASGTPGGILVYASDPDGVPTTIHFQATNGGLTNELYSNYGLSNSPNQAGTWASGDGWDQTATQELTHSINYQSVFVGLSFMAPKTLTRITWTFDRTLGAYIAANAVIVQILAKLAGVGVITQISADLGPQGTDVTFTWIGSQSVDRIIFNTNVGQANAPTNPGGTCTLKSVTYVEGGSNSNVRYSGDYGDTVGSALDLGSTAGASGGIDLARVNGVSFAAAEAEILRATTLGGAYSSFAASLGANPTSLLIPYYEVGSNTVSQTTSSSPQVVAGLSAAVGGTCLYYFDGGGTPTAITTPTSGAIIDGPDKITMLRGKKMAVIVNAGGFYKLYVTEDLASDGTATWTFVEYVHPDATLRVRRNDPRNGTHKGQIFVFDTPSGYSSRWAFAGEFDRVSPNGTILTGDVLG